MAVRYLDVAGEPAGAMTWRPSLQAATALIVCGDAGRGRATLIGCASRRGPAAISGCSPTRSWRWGR